MTRLSDSDRLTALRLRRYANMRAAATPLPGDDPALPLVGQLTIARVVYEHGPGSLRHITVTTRNGDTPRDIAAAILDVWYCDPSTIERVVECQISAHTSAFNWRARPLGKK